MPLTVSQVSVLRAASLVLTLNNTGESSCPDNPVGATVKLRDVE